MEQAELDKLMEELCAALRELGIPISQKLDSHVKINTRAKRRLGCCYFTQTGCVIEVSAGILNQRELLRLTLVHELLHTCPGCRNHGVKWKAWAQRAGAAMDLDIRRTVPVEGEAAPLRQEEVKYVLVCEACGARIPRKRMSKAVKRPWQYRCQCGGKLRRETVGESVPQEEVRG